MIEEIKNNIKYSSKLKNNWQLFVLELRRRYACFFIPVLTIFIYIVVDLFKSLLKKPKIESPRWPFICSILISLFILLYFVLMQIYRFKKYRYLLKPQEIKLLVNNDAISIETSTIIGYKIYKDEIAFYAGDIFDRKTYSFGKLNDTDFKFVIEYFKFNHVKELNVHEFI